MLRILNILLGMNYRQMELKRPDPLFKPWYPAAGLALIVTSLMALAGCQTQEPSADKVAAADAAVEESKNPQFIQSFSGVLIRSALAANRQGLTGAIDMKMTVNRQNQVIRCETRTKSQYSPLRTLSNPRLVTLVKEICWNAVFPEVSSKVFTSDADEQTIIAPLVFPGLAMLSTEGLTYRNQLVSQYEQSMFLWERTLAKQKVEGIGVASFYYVANAQGQVQECLVNLDRHPYRPQAFKPDSALQQHLSNQCKQLDLRQMPGFAVNGQGRAEGYVSVEYTPWKGGPTP